VADPQTELFVTLHHPESEPVTRVLREPPATAAGDGGEPPGDGVGDAGDVGDHPRPAEALAALEASDDPFAPVPPGTIATMIYGGPETATVSGTWRGRPVEATFSRNDGAQIARWKRVAPLLDIR
jgi:hypothetical protein